MKNSRSNGTNNYLRAAVRAALAIPVASSFVVMPAHAQDDNVIDQILVTATRREGSIQDVPINIAAVDGARITEQGFSNISDLLAFVPGINSLDQGGRNGNETIVRGLNADPLGQGGGNDNGTTVATYLGEVPVPIDFRLNDIQRVEVLLGPQGTLYGAGTLGGAIRFIPNKPDFVESLFEVRADANTVGEGDGVSSDVGFSGDMG